MITLKNYTLSENGRRIDFHYTATGSAERFLNPKENFFVRYDHDISSCPPGIAVIPFVANFITLAWFGGFDLTVSEVDSTFAESLQELRAEFQRMHTEYRVTGCLVAKHETKCNWEGDRALMLFSGGMDAYAGLIRHQHENLELVTVLGADIELSDQNQWHQCLSHIRNEPFSGKFPQQTVWANMRTFYTDNVEADLVFGWWGKVQHGLGLLGLLAPISFKRKASIAYIASTYSTPVAWGSTKASDDKIRWGGLKVLHDAAELTRQNKAQLIVAFASARQQPIQLRVCYSEIKRDGNCGRCEKCYRTIMNLVLAGADPRAFGFPFSEETYEKMFAYMLSIHASAGMKVFWLEIGDAAQVALNAKGYFVLADYDKESASIKRVANGEINRALERNYRPWRHRLARWKFIISVRFPRIYSLGRRFIRTFRAKK
jgi:hypothetical protein